MPLKILSIALLILGEGLAIYAEVVSANQFKNGIFLPIFLKMFLFMILAGGFLIAGYMLGFKSFKDIWIVSVISILAIIFMEPIINYSIFQELPGRGATTGLVFGILGLLSMVIL